MKLVNVIFIVLFSVVLSNCSKKEIRTVKIGMCSDIHVATMHDSKERLTAFIDSMKIAKPDFIIELGDLEMPKTDYQPFFDIWNSFSGSKYHVIGNHEMDGGVTLEEAIAYRKMKSSYYSFSKKGFKFIVLDGNDKKLAEQKGYRSFMGKKQLTWLKNELSRTEEPVVIFSHQGIGSDPNTPGERYSIENSIEVRQLFENHNKTAKGNRVVACFNGHTHHDFAEEINGIWYVTINSMAYKWLDEEYAHETYGEEIDKDFRWIQYTAPYKEPLFTVVEISSEGTIKMSGKKTAYVGATPWELGYPEHLKKYVRPEIKGRVMSFSID